ncbi:hypothetical protein D5R81_06070 [Parashewanella spongiae]|uniref:DUF2306 domain-containing protein n=2 Tax=Parashewanella spongiae TaxID=342950 RepID=A0A3A6UH27_9GAMM|nr:hypothetical protein D5R81_06070 [Parashewanella spongiae]
MFTFNSELLSLFGFEFMTNTLMTVHILAAIGLIFLMFTQIMITFYSSPSANIRKVHKIMGWFITTVSLPTFYVLSILSCLLIIKTPFNQFLFLLIGTVVLFAFIRSIMCATKRQYKKHVDYMLVAYLSLCTAGFYRIILFCLSKLGHDVLYMRGAEPIDGGLILTYALLATVLFMAFYQQKTIKDNANSLILIAGGLVISLIILPWDFWGHPN